MKQTVMLRVPIDDDWDAGVRLQVYTDFGTGTIDTDSPLLQRGLDLFPGKHRARGVGTQPVGVGRLGDHKAARPRAGIRHAIVGQTAVGTSPPFVVIPVQVPAAFGAWKFGVEAVDANGNVQGGGLAEVTAMVSGTEPPPLKSLSLVGYDATKDQLTLSFTREAE